MFKGLNNNIEAYIDGMTMKIQTIHNHLSNQEETFNTIKGFICAKTLLGMHSVSTEVKSYAS